jgi:hypothetical protein
MFAQNRSCNLAVALRRFGGVDNLAEGPERLVNLVFR